MRYSASVRSKWLNIGHWVLFWRFLLVRSSTLYLARPRCSQTNRALHTFWQIQVFDNTWRTLYITLDEAKAVSLFVLKHGGQFWKHLKFFLRLGLSKWTKWKRRKLEERRTNTVEHVDWSKKCFFYWFRKGN